MDKYKYIRIIGKGGFAEVHLIETNKQRFALKIIQKESKNFFSQIREIEANRRIRHPNIARFITSVEEPTNCLLIFEFIDGIDLMAFLESRKFKPIAETLAQHIAKQLIRAIRYIHKLNIFHRDLKLENVLITPQAKIKIIDLGLCAITSDFDSLDEFVGSVDYAAPEILLNNKYNGESIDVFSLGVILFSLVFGILPFPKSLRRKFVSGKTTVHPQIEYPEDVSASESAKELLEGMLALDPKDRLRMKQIKKQKWIQKSIVKKIFTLNSMKKHSKLMYY